MAYHCFRLDLRGFTIVAAAACLLACATPAAAQPAPCSLRLTATQVPVEQLTIADFDLNHFESRGLLFTVDISNPGPSPAEVQMKIVLMIQLATGEDFQPAANLTTEPFPVPVGGMTLTNLDLGQSKQIRFESYEIVDAARDAVEEQTLSSGLLPAGVYTFTFTVEPCPEATPVDVVIRIGNPSRLELISPRDGEGVGEFPFFEFYHEGRASRLTVTELNPGQTYEDAIERNPQMLQVDLGRERSYLYSGGRPLERGKSYTWRVQTLTTIAGGGTVDLSSPVRSFTVSEGGTYYDALLARLEAMYGLLYPDVFRAIRDGAYRPTGDYSLDGASLGEADLLKVLDALQQAIDSSELSFK